MVEWQHQPLTNPSICERLEMVFIQILIFSGRIILLSFHWKNFIDKIGPKVVSRSLTLSHLLSVKNVLKRRVTICENLNANDYDQRRLCLGPFPGRSPKISSEICGILTNSNCEFELNFIPFHTLGQWFQLGVNI